MAKTFEIQVRRVVERKEQIGQLGTFRIEGETAEEAQAQVLRNVEDGDFEDGDFEDQDTGGFWDEDTIEEAEIRSCVETDPDGNPL